MVFVTLLHALLVSFQVAGCLLTAYMQADILRYCICKSL